MTNLPTKVRSTLAYHHRTEEERARFDCLLQARLTVPMIAIQMGRDKSTLYREKKRNGRRDGDRKGVGAACRATGYSALVARSQACGWASRANARPRIAPEVWERAKGLFLDLDVSPRN
jgi:IS30 family transposase